MSTYDLPRSSKVPSILTGRASRPAGARSAATRPGPSMTARAASLALAYVLVTGGLLAGLLMHLREEAIGAGKRELAAFAQLVAGHTFEVALGLEQSLKLAEMTLAVATQSGTADQGSIGPMLREIDGNARALKDVLVLDERGRVVYQADGTGDIGLDWSDRPYLAKLRDGASSQFLLAAPIQRRSGAAAGEWSIPVVHGWRKAHGEFAGVIVGLMDPAFFAKTWHFDSEISGLSIALAAPDGTLIMRQPFAETMLGRSIVDEQMRLRIAGERAADTLIIRDPLDGQSKLVAYRRVAAYPDLVIFVAQPKEVVLAGWRRIAWLAGTGWLAASLALGGLGAWLAREMKARSALEARYHALFDAIPYPVIVSNPATQEILAFNDAAVEQYGWSKHDVTGPGQGPRLPPDFAALASRRQEFSRDFGRLVPGQRHRNAQGAAIDVELTVRLIEFNGLPADLTVAVDVSDRLKAEQARHAAEDQLRQSQKMDALGQLTGGIAHDFNNVLMVIMDGVEELGEKDSLDVDTRRGLDRIATAARRAEELTRQMLAFSRKQPLRPRAVNVNDLVADTGKLLRRTLGEQVEIDSILADDLWTVEVDAVQLETSLVHLCLNARDAMPKGGRVLIETSNVTIDRDQAAREPGLAPGEFVLVAVSDTGHGILPQHVDKVFEPFFTTKASGTGTGLGLSTVYGFVKQSNGHIGVSSEVDHGTAFRIYLPRHTGAPTPAASEAGATVAGGTERVLVVEDDAHVRASVVRQLRSLGYQVSEAENGAAGLAAFERSSSPFDLLLTDVVMPGGMNGKGLADEVGRRWPGTSIVFMSGYTDNALIFGGSIASDVRLLSKPFRKGDLARMLRRALDNRGLARGDAP